MNKNYKHIEDFLTDESFRNWVNNPSPELERHWNNWLEANKDKEELFNQAKLVVSSLKFKKYEPDSGSKRRILKQIKAYDKPKSHPAVSLNNWYKVAAVLAMVISIASLAYFISTNSVDDKFYLGGSDILSKENVAGVKSEHLLSDGTKIYLNSTSSIEYPKTFSGDKRVVKLHTGEAYFDVAHDSNRPFIVQTSDYDVEVLGTEFNMTTNLKSSEIALLSGKVRLNFNSGNFSLELKPGQMATFDKETGKISTTSFDSLKTAGWKDGYLVFQDASFQEVIDKLQTWYGIKVSVLIEQPVTDWSYTGTFNNESLENVLLNLKTLRRFEYQIKDDSLIISK